MPSFFEQYLCTNLVQASGLFLLGYLFVYKPARLLFSWLQNCTYSSCKSAQLLKAGPNDYAVITGSSDGIGLEYARQLAEKGFNLLLLSRTQEKLERVAAEIQQKYPQCKKIETLAVDFTRTDIYERIKDKLASLDGRLYILVNNVGMMHPIPMPFADFPEGLNQKVILANCLSMTTMSEYFLKQILTQKRSCPHDKRPTGIIINISSMVSLMEIPTFSVYGATKAYMTYLSKVLATEYQPHNILVQTVVPNQVVTAMSREVNDPTLSVSAESYVQYALRSLGTESVTSAHPKHKLINSLFVLLDQWMPTEWFQRRMLDVMVKKSNELKMKRELEAKNQ